MSSDLFRNKYRIPSARATWHDYNGGAYFVTICTRDMVHYFGEIVSGEMNMTEIGEYVQQCIKNIPQHNTYANVPAFVVMPNHVHLIVIIDDENADSICRDVPWRVSTYGKNETMQTIANQQGRLSTMIGGFKQSVTRYANANSISFAWQTRFHDRIIRDHDEMNRIAEYIENNVARWESDEFHNSSQNDSKAKAE
jgi:REP element-mobilizing transposase RayT